MNEVSSLLLKGEAMSVLRPIFFFVFLFYNVS